MLDSHLVWRAVQYSGLKVLIFCLNWELHYSCHSFGLLVVTHKLLAYNIAGVKTL